MTEIEKCTILKDRGYIYNPLSGNIKGVKGLIKGPTTMKYIQISFRKNNIKYSVYAHRYAWYLTYNYLPLEIDHINRNKKDNRLCNLRNVSKSENMFNLKNTKGYYFNKRDNVYYSRITVNKITYSLGYHLTEEEARNAYLEAKKKYHIFKKD